MDEWMPVTLVGRDFRADVTATYERAAIIPPQGALYALFRRPGEDPPLPPPFGQQVGAPLAFDDGTQVTIWRVKPGDQRIAHPADLPSDVGVSYIGYTLDGELMPGASAALYTFWRVDALRPERGIWSFLPVAKVFDAQGAQVASDQGHAVSALTWAVGDVIVQPLALTLPKDAPPPFEIQLSLFDPVRVREDGGVGINAVFWVDRGNGELEYSAAFWLDLSQ
jgi:hypothetical protein